MKPRSKKTGRILLPASVRFQPFISRCFMGISSPVCGLVLSALMLLGGCAPDTVTTTIGGREATASASGANLLYVRSEANRATFQIDDAIVTVTPEQVLRGKSSLNLPTDWKRVQLVSTGRGIAILVDGRPFRQLGPAG